MSEMEIDTTVVKEETEEDLNDQLLKLEKLVQKQQEKDDIPVPVKRGKGRPRKVDTPVVKKEPSIQSDETPVSPKVDIKVQQARDFKKKNQEMDERKEAKRQAEADKLVVRKQKRARAMVLLEKRFSKKEAKTLDRLINEESDSEMSESESEEVKEEKVPSPMPVIIVEGVKPSKTLGGDIQSLVPRKTVTGNNVFKVKAGDVHKKLAELRAQLKRNEK